jgi:hypothetical protein
MKYYASAVELQCEIRLPAIKFHGTALTPELSEIWTWAQEFYTGFGAF